MFEWGLGDSGARGPFRRASIFWGVMRGRARFHSSPDGPWVVERGGAASRRAEGATNTWRPSRSCPFVVLSLGQEWARTESRPTAVTRWGRARFHSSPDGPWVVERGGAASRRAERATNTWRPLRSCPFVVLSLGQEWARTESRPTAVTRWGRARFHSSPDGPWVVERGGAASRRAEGATNTWRPSRSCPFVILSLGQEWARTESRPTAVTRWGRARFHSSPDGPWVVERGGAASRRAEGATNTWRPSRSCPFVVLSLGQEWARTESRPTAVTRWGRARFHSSPDGPWVVERGGAASRRAERATNTWRPSRSCPFVSLSVGQEWARQSLSLPP
jgi:hypothetical protein